MLKLVKTILTTIFWTTLVCVAVIFLVLSTVNPNHFRNIISKQVSIFSDYNMAIEGDLSWGFWPALSVELENVTIAQNNTTAPATKIFAEIISVSADSKRLLNFSKKEQNILFVAKNGSINGFDVSAILSAIEEMIGCICLVSVPIAGQTNFDQISGTIKYSDKIFKNDDLMLQGDGFTLTGAGIIANFNKDYTAYNLVLRINSLKDSPNKTRQYLNNIAIPVNCSGSSSSIKCLPQFDLVFDEIVKNVAKQKFKNLKIDAKNNIQSKIEQTMEDVSENLKEKLNDSIDPKKMLKKLFKF